MRVLRTPDECFEGLPGYPYAPKYEVVDADCELRMHYVAEGPKDGRQVLLLHPAPAWSYLYRSIIPILAEAGCRVIAPDRIGFGRSDKPADPADHDFARHLEWTAAFAAAIVKAGALLVSDGWLGLHLAAADPGRFSAVVAIDAAPLDEDDYFDEEPADDDDDEREPEELTTGDVIQIGTMRSLSAKVLAAYDAPFAEPEHEAALLAPSLEPSDDDSERVIERLGQLEAPLLLVRASDAASELGDPDVLRDRIPGARRCEPVTLRGAGRFVQEDRGPELAAEILALAAKL